MEFKISRNLRFDVVVCGSGPSGFAAAIQAARTGLSVAIIEQAGCFGGNMTNGGVSHLLAGRRWDEPSQKMIREVGGIFDELTDELISDGKAIDPDTIDVHNNNPYGWYPRMAAGIACDIEALKLKLDDWILKNGIKPFLFTTIVGAEVLNRKIRRIIAHDQSGFIGFEADTFIDATGDAQVAFISGCPVYKGREEDNLTTPASLIMHVDNVNLADYVAYQNAHHQPKLIDIINELREKGIWKFPFEIFIAIKLNDPDVCMVNTVRQVGIVGTDAASLTAGMIEGRKVSDELLSIMRSYFPGFKNARLRFTANRIGIRESRRIVGRGYVSLEDAENGRRYADEVLKTTYNFDLPDPKRPSFDPMLGSVTDPNARRKHIAIYAPYSVMIPQNIDNLIVPGRAVSVSREVLGPMRITGPAMMGGQAAGFACYIAAQEGRNVCDVDGAKVKSMMIDAGVLL